MSVESSENIQDVSEEMHNTLRFLRELSRPLAIRLIRTLHNGPQTYAKLYHDINPVGKRRSGRFAYYIRHLVAAQLIRLDRTTKQYYLTFRGVKAVELLEGVEKIANLSIDTMSNAKAKLAVDLNESKSWLAPLIKTEIRRAVREIKH